MQIQHDSGGLRLKIFPRGCLSTIFWFALVVAIIKVTCAVVGELDYRCQGWQQRVQECTSNCAYLEQDRPLGCSW